MKGSRFAVHGFSCLFALSLATGCIGGYSYDLAGQPFTNISVYAQTCPTCAFQGPQYPDSTGLWNFDPYNGEPIVSPSNGEEATRFLLIPPDLASTYAVFHRPSWVLYNGENISGVRSVYFPPQASVDTDGDMLPDIVETSIYHTDPTKKDTDGDGVGDGAEVLGLDWVDYPSFGANPLHKDIFVELDYMYYTDAGGVHSWKFGDALVQKIQNFYASQPVSNPDGTTGFNIHIFQDSQIPQGTRCYSAWTQAGSLFNPRHVAAFHYVAVCNNPNKPNDWTSQAQGSPRAFLDGPAPDNDSTNDQQEVSIWHYYSNFIHEVGHTLGLNHGGGGAAIINCKPNYPSVMNYMYEYGFNGDGPWYGGTLATTQLQYSNGALPTLVQTNLLEQNSFPGIPAASLTFLSSNGANWAQRIVAGNAQVDWNRDTNYSAAPVSVFLLTSTNVLCPAGNATSTPLPDYNDATLISTGLPHVVGGAGDSAPSPDTTDLRAAVANASPGSTGLTSALQRYLQNQKVRTTADILKDADQKLAAKHAALAALGWNLKGLECEGTAPPPTSGPFAP